MIDQIKIDLESRLKSKKFLGDLISLLETNVEYNKYIDLYRNCSYRRYLNEYVRLNINSTRQNKYNVSIYHNFRTDSSFEKERLRSKLYEAPCKMCEVCTARKKSW